MEDGKERNKVERAIKTRKLEEILSVRLRPYKPRPVISPTSPLCSSFTSGRVAASRFFTSFLFIHFYTIFVVLRLALLFFKFLHETAKRISFEACNILLPLSLLDEEEVSRVLAQVERFPREDIRVSYWQ